MSETSTETTETTTEITTEASATDLAAELEKWKNLSRKNEARAKENADAARKLAALEEASKSDMQRAVERAEAAEKALTEVSSKQMRLEVGATKGLTLHQSMRLVGSTPEDLAADADAFLAEIKPTTKGPAFAGGPRVTAPESKDPAQQFAAFLNGALHPE